MFLFKNDIPCAVMSFLRASGGVSMHDAIYENLTKFSPRKRRCFLHKQIHTADNGVFSAQAEVFLKATVTG